MTGKLSAWSNFYLTTATAASALTGLQFIVQTLLASNALRLMTATGDPEAAIAAFGTPTVVHLALTLLISATLCAPWTSYGALEVMLALVGAGALGYSAIVFRRARRQQNYVPTAYDWFWHVLLPAAAHIAVIVAAVLMVMESSSAFIVLAGAILTLLGVGIHNAWDTITYLTIEAVRLQSKEDIAAAPVPAAGRPASRRRRRPRPH